MLRSRTVVVTAAALVAVGLLAPSAGGAESAEELRQRIERAQVELGERGDRAQQAEEQLQEVEEQVPDARSAFEEADQRLVAAEQRLRELESELEAARAAVVVAEQELARTREELAASVRELARIEAELDTERGTLRQQVVAFYKYGTTTANRSLIRSLSSSGSVSDLSHNAHLAGAVGDHQARVVEHIATLEAAAADERDRLVTLEADHEAASEAAAAAAAEVERLTDDQRGLVAELETVRAEREATFAALQADVTAARTAIEELEEESRAIEAQLRDLARAEEAARAEEERVRRAEEEQRRREEEERRRREQEQEEASQGSDDTRSEPADPPPSSDSSIRPLTFPANGPVTSPYGYRTHPISGERKLHAGIDIGAPNGSTVVAAAGGTVVYAGWYSGYGLAVVINHGDGIATLYAHHSSLSVSTGQKVGRGQRVGAVGSTGYSTGPHLHFEVRKNGTPVDPMPYFR